MALCSESIGRIVTPAGARRPHEQLAGRDQALLVGQRDAAYPARSPRRSARARPRRRSRRPPGRPAASAASMTASAPAAACDAGAGKGRLQGRVAGRIGNHREPWRRAARATSASFAALALAVTASTAYAAGLAAITASVLVPMEPVAPRMVMRFGAVRLDRRLRQRCGGRYHCRRPIGKAPFPAVEPTDQQRQSRRERPGRPPGP